MDNKQKTIQVYAVVISVVTVVAIIICTADLISTLIDSTDALHAGHYEVQLTPSENFKMATLKPTQKDQAYIPTNEPIRKMYESAKADKIMLVKHYTNRTIIVNSFLLVISVTLLAFHWRLMRRVGNENINKVNSG